jgi:predicted GNAT family acetyltransferase
LRTTPSAVTRAPFEPLASCESLDGVADRSAMDAGPTFVERDLIDLMLPSTRETLRGNGAARQLTKNAVRHPEKT